METDKRVINVDSLVFDKMNPRLPKKLQGITDETVVIDYLLRNGSILELMKSIAETGYFVAEPMLVVQGDDNKYIVVEGNRRLSAVKLLNNPNLAKVRKGSVMEIVRSAVTIPKEIPVIVYQKREDILDYLGYRHITGVKEWGALEKARYLDQLYNIHYSEENREGIYSKLAKMIGSRADYVKRLHQALYLYTLANEEAYFGTGVTEEEISFSLITTAIGYSGIISFINLTEDIGQIDKDNYKQLFIWMFDPKRKVIGDSRQISSLANIVSQENSLKKLKAGSSVEEAILYTSVPSEAFIEMLKNARNSLKQAKEAIEQLSEEPEETRDLLEQIVKLVNTIKGGLDSNFKKDTIDLESFSIEDQQELFKMLYNKLQNR